MGAGSVRPLYHPLPCITTRKCALGSSPRSPPEALAASPVAEGVMAAMGVLPRLPPRRMARLLPQTPRLQHPSCLADITTLQWMRDIPPPQVPQGLKGLLRQKEEKEEEGHEHCQEELQPQGTQGQWPPLG